MPKNALLLGIIIVIIIVIFMAIVSTIIIIIIIIISIVIVILLPLFVWQLMYDGGGYTTFLQNTITNPSLFFISLL